MKRNASYERFSKRDDGGGSWLARIAGGAGGPDQRRSQRRSITMEVTLGQCLSCFGKWSVRNLSLHGAFLVGAQEPVPVGTLLDVAFRHAPKGVPVMRYVAARVVRVESEGLALNFSRYGKVVYTDLVALLRPM